MENIRRVYDNKANPLVAHKVNEQLNTYLDCDYRNYDLQLIKPQYDL